MEDFICPNCGIITTNTLVDTVCPGCKKVLFVVTQDKVKYPIKEYDIWESGYLDQGMEGVPAKAFYRGKEWGRNFQDACMRYFLKSEYENRIKYDEEDKYFDTKRWDYDPYTNRYWGCGLYENEADARKSFG